MTAIVLYQLADTIVLKIASQKPSLGVSGQLMESNPDDSISLSISNCRVIYKLQELEVPEQDGSKIVIRKKINCQDLISELADGEESGLALETDLSRKELWHPAAGVAWKTLIENKYEPTNSSLKGEKF